VAAIVHKFIPMNPAGAVPFAKLTGREGTSTLRIDDSFGLATVNDDGGARVQVPCRVAPGEEPIHAGERIVLMRLDRAARVFYVTTPSRWAARKPATAKGPP
jgi:hypothetical protein